MVKPMVVQDGAIERALRGLEDRSRRDAESESEELARRLEFLTWGDRADILDDFFWDHAKSRLRHEVITAVVNRRGRDDAVAAAEIEQYALYCRAVLTAAILRMPESVRIDGPASALTYRLSTLRRHAGPAEAWLDGVGFDCVPAELARRPGYAFLILTLSPNDAVESFVARDAFFAAMLGSP
jgi:hypothetical protein